MRGVNPGAAIQIRAVRRTTMRADCHWSARPTMGLAITDRGTPTAAPAATLAEAAIVVVAMAAAETAAVAAIDRRTPRATQAYPYSERAIISFMISFAPP